MGTYVTDDEPFALGQQSVKLIMGVVDVAGTLPAFWGSNLTNLVTLDLSNNKLSSSLPSGTRKLSLHCSAI